MLEALSHCFETLILDYIVDIYIILEVMFMKHYAPNRYEPSIEALNFRGGGGGIRVNVRCERRGEVFLKIQKKNGGGGCQVGGGGGGRDGRGGCDRRIEVFVKIQKKWGGGSGSRGGVSGWGGGVRVDVTKK